jgi:Ca-activated chloride channel family protein
MDRTPPSTGTMMDDCVTNPTCKTLFTYEDLVIERNKDLVAKGHEPLYVVYPRESLAISDAPLGFLPHAGGQNPAKLDTFRRLQDYLLSAEGQIKLRLLGRRPVTSIGLTLPGADKAVFNPDWGIKPDIQAQLLTYPAGPVIQGVLRNYQIAFRQPVDTAYCIDGSGSMDGNGGWAEVQQAGQILFDQTQAAQYYLLANPGDRTTVAVFSDHVKNGPWSVSGNDPAQLLGLLHKLQGARADGGTNMYGCLRQIADLFEKQPLPDHKRFVVLMTDGQSDQDNVSATIARLKDLQVPVIAIAFGSADLSQLTALADATGGSVIKKSNVADGLREATGYK